MSNFEKRLYKNRAALNVLTGSVENAKQIFAAAQGHVLVGMLSKNYATAEEAVVAMRACGAFIDDAVSIGLGGGDHRQAAMVTEITRHYEGAHINQAFPAVGATREALGKRSGWINAMIAPTGRVGYVNISIGEHSAAQEQKAIVPIEAAIALVRDMGGNALKYFPMQGLKLEDEYRAVVAACAQANFALEPTGGIDLENFSPIVEIALAAGVPQVIPHVYTSIIDPATGDTRPEQVAQLLAELQVLVDKYE